MFKFKLKMAISIEKFPLKGKKYSFQVLNYIWGKYLYFGQNKCIYKMYKAMRI